MRCRTVANYVSAEEPSNGGKLAAVGEAARIRLQRREDVRGRRENADPVLGNNWITKKNILSVESQLVQVSTNEHQSKPADFEEKAPNFKSNFC